MTVRTLQCFLVQALDMNILQSIVDGEHENRLGQWQQREELRREASEMLNDFREQIRLEKEKEEEVDAMFQSVVSPCDLERERERPSGYLFEGKRRPRNGLDVNSSGNVRKRRERSSCVK